ncbi:MAG: FHA domain-containing protein [Lachnospiraceae bacterium]|nr:FHA domain-containing protein [Lachnospiraceae bacterium]
MDRFAKRWRVAGGLLLLFHLVVFFLPVTNRVQENYATLRWSQYDYLENMLYGNLPHGTETPVKLEGEQMVFIICFMIIPVLFVLVAGIYGVVGSSRQIVSSILAFLVSGLSLVFVILMPYLWPESGKGQSYERGIGCVVLLVLLIFSSMVSVLALLATPKAETASIDGIPQIAQMKQEQITAKYNLISENQASSQVGGKNYCVIPPYIAGTSRGVLVGLSGLYAGAEITVADGETIRLGRSNNNDLVFENQPKVSRNHCQIQWDAERKKYSIRDYSSNGSFANGSEECLPQNIDISLEPGTIIAVGDQSNQFRLE